MKYITFLYLLCLCTKAYGMDAIPPEYYQDRARTFMQELQDLQKYPSDQGWQSGQEFLEFLKGKESISRKQYNLRDVTIKACQSPLAKTCWQEGEWFAHFFARLQDPYSRAVALFAVHNLKLHADHLAASTRSCSYEQFKQLEHPYSKCSFLSLAEEEEWYKRAIDLTAEQQDDLFIESTQAFATEVLALLEVTKSPATAQKSN